MFRKWGRVGNEKIGGDKLQEMSKLDAIQEFKRLFLEKTGNTWEAWEGKKIFQKQPGRFFPLDIVWLILFLILLKFLQCEIGAVSFATPQKPLLFSPLHDVEILDFVGLWGE